MPERFGALPLGELHPEGVCAYCGHKAPIHEGQWDDPEPDYGNALRRTVHVMTQAVALVCWDTVACERRRYRLKL